jgi:hypothetical protein
MNIDRLPCPCQLSRGKTIGSDSGQLRQHRSLAKAPINGRSPVVAHIVGLAVHSRLGLVPLAPEAATGVRVLTMHGAKGLQAKARGERQCRGLRNCQ